MNKLIAILVLLCFFLACSSVHGLLVKNYNIPLAENTLSVFTRDSQFYYFAHQNGLTRVRISDNTRVGYLPISTTEVKITGLCLDTANNFGYMLITNTAPTLGLTVAQFTLNSQNFTRTGQTILLAVETATNGGICNFDSVGSPSKLFVGITHATLPAQIVQIDITYTNPAMPTITRNGAISLQEPEVQVNTVCVDFATSTAFYGLNSNRIAIINMATFTRTTVSNTIDTASTGGASFSVLSCIIDGANVYFGLASGHIVKTTKTNVNVAVGTVPRIQNAGVDVNIFGFGVDAGNFLYGTGRSGASTGVLFKVDFATMAAITVQNLLDGAAAVIPIGGNFPMTGAGATARFQAAFSGATNGKMRTYDNNLAVVAAAASVNLNEAITGIVAVSRNADSNGNFYVATNGPGTIWHIRQTDFTQIRKCAMNGGETIASLHTDGTNLVVGTTAGDIVRFDNNCNRQTWNPTNVLGAGRSCNIIIQDSPVSSNVYCFSTSHTAIARVNRNDATMAVTRVLFLNEPQASIAAYDPVHNIIYAVSQNTNPNVPTMIRFRLTDFVRLSTPTLFGGFPNTISAIDVDSLGNVFVASGGAVLGVNTNVRVYKFAAGMTSLNATYTAGDVNANSLRIINDVVYLSNAIGTVGTISQFVRLSTLSLNTIDSFSWINNNGADLRPYSSQVSAPFGAIAYSVPSTQVVTFVGREAQPVFWNIALCPSNQYFDYNNDGCSCCPAGTFLSGGSCVICPGGQYCPACVTSGTACSPGWYCPPGTANNQTLTCALGSFSGSGAAQCTICPAGSYCPLTVASGNVQCPAGTYNMLTGQFSASACIPCPAGTASATVGAGLNTTCVQCTVGRVAPNTGSASCAIQCPPGSTNDPTFTFCTPCLPGTSNPNFAAACTDCAAGTYSSSFASLKCVACPAGTFGANTKATTCTPCAAGTITNIVGQTVCTDCAAGQYQPLAGQTQCLVCAAGQYQNATKSTSCNPCPIGYSSGVGGQTGAIYCAACPPGTWNNQQVGTNDCFSCPAGTYTPFYGTTTRCFACPPGQVPGTPTTGIQNLGGTHCTLCPVGTYKPSNGQGDSCINCPAGWYQPQTGQSSCTPCPAGLSSGAAASICTPCAPGQYSNFDAVVGGVCKACPSGHVSPFYGSTNCTKCADGFKSDAAGVMCVACQMGFYGRDGICAQCPVGTYNDQIGASSCKMCPPGTFQNAAGSFTCQPCAPGSYAPNNGSQVCTTCLQGSYSTGVFQIGDFFIGATTCSLCPAGWTSTTTGATACTQCPKGTYGAFPGAACETCRAGTVSPLVQQTQCQVCPPGTTSGVTAVAGGDTSKLAGEDTCQLCPVDTFAPMAGSPQCMLCPAGYFTNNTRGNSGCLTCADGEYTGAATAGTIKHCIKCQPGKYLPPGVKAAQCFDCPAGTFALGYGNTNCTPCPAGSKSGATAATAASTCTLCEIGTYSSAGSTACRACPFGSFSFPPSKAGATSCKFCPAGTFSNVIDGNVGDTLCIPCPAGYYSANEGAHNPTNTTNNVYHFNSFELSCKPCPAGFYTDKAGSAQCLPCPQSTYADTPASATCKPCPGNTYNSNYGSTHFLNCTAACPIGWTNQQNAQGLNKSDLCTPCPAGTFWNGYSSPCTPCPANTFNPKLAQTQCFACPNSTAVGLTSCCKEVVNNGTSSQVCLSTGSFGKFFNPLYIVAAIALALSLMM